MFKEFAFCVCFQNGDEFTQDFGLIVSESEQIAREQLKCFYQNSTFISVIENDEDEDELYS